MAQTNVYLSRIPLDLVNSYLCQRAEQKQTGNSVYGLGNAKIEVEEFCGLTKIIATKPRFKRNSRLNEFLVFCNAVYS